MRKIAVVLILLLGLVSLAALTPVAAQEGGGGACWGAPTPRLVPGQQGRITPGLPNVIRSQPWRGAGSVVIGQIPAGGVFSVLYGYAAQCNDGMWWFYINYNGVVGWTAEGSAYGVYWTEPVTGGPTYPLPGCGYLTPRLTIGGQGRVTPGLPNALRTQPYRGGDSLNIGIIPAGGVFTVLNGPTCNQSVQWWLVSYNGITGWTGEGEGATYWVEPVFLPPTPVPSGCGTPQLQVGASGFVPSGFGVPLYANVGTGSGTVATIPGGGWFSVVAGPSCAGGANWFYVRYGGLNGWVNETGNAVSPYVCAGFRPSRLLPGTMARVTPGLPNNLRSQPYIGAPILGRIPAGGTFSIVGGPQCGNEGAWWQVYYNGVYGWTMEGRGAAYWVEPAS